MTEMDNINIVNRDLNSDELDSVNSGFDAVSLEEGVELESTERISFVALDGDRFVGCASGLAHKNGDQYSGWFHLTDLFVQKESRNQGLGAELLKELEGRLTEQGMRRIWLWTSGLPTLKFYDRHGYAPFAEMENWYSDGSSRVGLRKDLGERNRSNK